MTSSTSASNSSLFLSNSSSASSPLPVMCTEWPSASRLKRSPCARCASSSTTILGSCAINPRQTERKRAAAPRSFALGVGVPAVAPGYRAHDEQAKPCPLHLAGILHPVKAVKDALQLHARNSDSAVSNVQTNRVDIRCEHVYFDVFMIFGVFDGVVDEVEDRGTQLFGIAQNRELFVRFFAES